MSCLPAAKRYPRSLAESPAYDPAWRYLQTEEYLRFRRHLGDQAGTFILPATERDSIVRAYFKFRTDVPTAKVAAFRYSQDCDDTNDRTFMGTRIKSMSVAGLTTSEIATRIHTSAENIETFQKLFFDIGECQGDPAALTALLAPMVEYSTATNARERVWLLAALQLGVRGLDYVMDQRVKLTAEEEREISNSIHNLLGQQCLRYTLSLQGKADAGPETLDAYQKSLQTRARTPAEDNTKAMIFQEAIVEAARKKFGLPAPSPTSSAR